MLCLFYAAITQCNCTLSFTTNSYVVVVVFLVYIQYIYKVRGPKPNYLHQDMLKKLFTK